VSALEIVMWAAFVAGGLVVGLTLLQLLRG